MIKKIYYWDGVLIASDGKGRPNGCIPSIPHSVDSDIGLMDDETRLILIDARDGWRINDKDLDFCKTHSRAFTVLTNQPSALCFDWFECADNLDVKDKVYLYSKKKKEWLPIECYTDRELRYAHNLEKMYKAGAFERLDEEE